MTEAQLPPMQSTRKRPRTDATFINSMQFTFIDCNFILLIVMAIGISIVIPNYLSYLLNQVLFNK